MGRPTDYTEELGAEICARIANGDSVRTICKADDMPASSSIFLWLSQHSEFSENYEKARQERAEGIYEETLEISDDGTNDWMERRSESEKGAGVLTGWVLNGEHVQRSRLRVDTRKWFLARMNPKKYGEKITQEQTGPDGGAIVTEVRVTIVDPKVTEK